mgnify:CR=1 FL=1
MRKVGIKNLPFDKVHVVLSIGALCMIKLTGCCANVLYADGSGGIVEFLGGSSVHNSVATNTSSSPCKLMR